MHPIWNVTDLQSNEWFLAKDYEILGKLSQVDESDRKTCLTEEQVKPQQLQVICPKCEQGKI